MVKQRDLSGQPLTCVAGRAKQSAHVLTRLLQFYKSEVLKWFKPPSFSTLAATLLLSGHQHFCDQA